MIAVELPLDIRTAAFARRSSLRATWDVAFVRQLGLDEVSQIQLARATMPADLRAPLVKIRQPHHMLAKLVSEGKPTVEISAITGYSPSRIATFRHDPAFRELVAFYEEQAVMSHPDVVAQIRHITLTAAQEIQERLEEDPSKFSNKELRDLMAAGLDRTGHGPQSNVNMNVNDTAKIIEQIRQQVELESRGRIVSKTEAITTTYEVIDNGQTSTDETSQESGSRTDRAIRPAEIERSSGGGDCVSTEGSPGT